MTHVTVPRWQRRQHGPSQDVVLYRSPFRSKRLDVVIAATPLSRILPHYANTSPQLTRAPSPAPFRLPGVPARLGPRTSGRGILHRSIFACSITGVRHALNRQSRARGMSLTAKISSRSICDACMLHLLSRRLLQRATVSCRWNGRPTSRTCNNRV